MLKKAGIVVAAAAVGLLAVSPLAFAGEKSHGHGHGHGYDQTNTATESSQGLVNVSDINANVPVNALNCLDADVPVLGLNENVVPIAGALALLGAAESENNTAIDDSCANAQGASSVDNVGQENDD